MNLYISHISHTLSYPIIIVEGPGWQSLRLICALLTRKLVTTVVAAAGATTLTLLRPAEGGKRVRSIWEDE